MINIEKIDYVIEQTGAEYGAVRTALIISDGDVEKAINFIESNQTKKISDESTVNDSQYSEGGENWEEQYDKRHKQNPIGAFAQDIIDTIQEIWEKGNASNLVIEKDGKTILSLSLTVSTIGLVIAPVAAIIGLGAAFITEYSIKIIMDSGEVVDVNKEAVRRKMNKGYKEEEKQEDQDHNEEKQNMRKKTLNSRVFFDGKIKIC